MAAHNWRVLREKALRNGVELMGLTSMHAVLDMMEQVGLESATSGVKTEAELRSAMGSYYSKLYRPDMTTRQIDGDGYLPPPPGFSDEEIEASFDAFLQQPMR